MLGSLEHIETCCLHHQGWWTDWWWKEQVCLKQWNISCRMYRNTTTVEKTSNITILVKFTLIYWNQVFECNVTFGSNNGLLSKYELSIGVLKNNPHCPVRSEVSMNVKIKTVVFWDVTSFSLMCGAHFGGTCCLCLHGRWRQHPTQKYL